MQKIKKKLLCFVSLFIYLAIFVYLHKNLTNKANHRKFYRAFIPLVHDQNNSWTCREKVQDQCLQLFTQIVSYNRELIFRPPLRSPPVHLFNEFTQNGKMPLTSLIYYNEVHTDFFDVADDSKAWPIIRNKTVDKWLKKANSSDNLEYNDRLLKKSMDQYSTRIQNQKFLVIGTEYIWIEALALLFQASQVTTLEYTHKLYERGDLKWFHVFEFLKLSIEKEVAAQFANAASYSSIEHTGLGRYGEPLSPSGDLHAIQMINCLLKPRGLFFLSLPTSKDNSSYLEFNARRIYGHDRLEIILKDWTVLKTMKNIGDTFDDTLFILEKKDRCVEVLQN